jgi:hypothetical protein
VGPNSAALPEAKAPTGLVSNKRRFLTSPSSRSEGGVGGDRTMPSTLLPVGVRAGSPRWLGLQERPGGGSRAGAIAKGPDSVLTSTSAARRAASR